MRLPIQTTTREWKGLDRVEIRHGVVSADGDGDTGGIMVGSADYQFWTLGIEKSRHIRKC